MASMKRGKLGGKFTMPCSGTQMMMTHMPARKEGPMMKPSQMKDTNIWIGAARLAAGWRMGTRVGARVSVVGGRGRQGPQRRCFCRAFPTHRQRCC